MKRKLLCLLATLFVVSPAFALDPFVVDDHVFDGCVKLKGINCHNENLRRKLAKMLDVQEAAEESKSENSVESGEESEQEQI